MFVQLKPANLGRNKHCITNLFPPKETRDTLPFSDLICFSPVVSNIFPILGNDTFFFVLIQQQPLDVTNHSVAREVVTFFTLPPGDYIVVPQTNVPNCDGKFLLRILTDEQVTNFCEKVEYIVGSFYFFKKMCGKLM